VFFCVKKLSFEQNLITDEAVSVLNQWTTLHGLQVRFFVQVCFLLCVLVLSLQ
jgi:hypothetical protein